MVEIETILHDKIKKDIERARVFTIDLDRDIKIPTFSVVLEYLLNRGKK